MSQDEMILNALKQGDRLTSLEALARFQCMRLASRIADLRSKGHTIHDRTILTPSGKRVSEYWMETGSLFPDSLSKRYQIYGGL